MRRSKAKATLDRSDPRPLYVQLARSLRSDIVSGKLSSGTRIPTTAELARRTGVSSITVNLAIAELVREGLLSRRPKLGTFVTGMTRDGDGVSALALSPRPSHFLGPAS